MAYPISEIQGIGTDVAAILKSDGIRTTVTLLRLAKTPKQSLMLALKTGTPEKNVLDWVTAADRMRIKGVGWEYAELLRAAGVRTVNELRYRNPQKLAEVMAEVNTDRKSTRLNSSHMSISYAVFCSKKKRRDNNHHHGDHPK